MSLTASTTLAMLGGEPAVAREARRVEWPVVTDGDRQAVMDVLASGRFTSAAPVTTEVDRLEEEWARFVGVDHCVATSSGTAALAVALAAVGVEPGAEVLVPALTFAATGLAALHQLAVPVFVDVDPRTFAIDADRAEAAVTERTQAILPVHLHGLPADMRGVRRVAGRHGLAVVEDAAQAQGACFEGRRTGGLGDAGAFSLNVSKNLPTCGEGGLLTIGDAGVRDRAVRLRQFGETLVPGREREYRSESLGWNYKLSTVQAAFARSQLARFPEWQAAREANVRAFLDAIRDLPGLTLPEVPQDRTHAWHMIRFRLDPAAAGLDGVRPGAFRQAVQRALRAEGVPVQRYQSMPLTDQEVFRRRQGYGRGYPWTISGAAPGDDPVPHTRQILEDSLTIQRVHLPPTSGTLLARCAEAFQKVWANREVLGAMARSRG